MDPLDIELERILAEVEEEESAPPPAAIAPVLTPTEIQPSVAEAEPTLTLLPPLIETAPFPLEVPAQPLAPVPVLELPGIRRAAKKALPTAEEQAELRRRFAEEQSRREREQRAAERAARERREAEQRKKKEEERQLDIAARKAPMGEKRRGVTKKKLAAKKKKQSEVERELEEFLLAPTPAAQIPTAEEASRFLFPPTTEAAEEYLFAGPVGEPRRDLEIVGLVGMLCTYAEMELLPLNFKFRNSYYHATWRSLHLALTNPRCAIAIFEKKGNIISLGTKSLVDLQRSLKKTVKIVSRFGYPDLQYTEPVILNVAKSTTLKFDLNLEGVEDDSKITDLFRVTRVEELSEFPGRDFLDKSNSVLATVFEKTGSVIFKITRDPTRFQAVPSVRRKQVSEQNEREMKQLDIDRINQLTASSESNRLQTAEAERIGVEEIEARYAPQIRKLEDTPTAFNVNTLRELTAAKQQEIDIFRRDQRALAQRTLANTLQSIEDRYAEQRLKKIADFETAMEDALQQDVQEQRGKEQLEKYSREISAPEGDGFTLPGLQRRIHETYDRLIPILERYYSV